MRLIELLKQDISHLKASIIVGPEEYKGVRSLFVDYLGYEDNANRLLRLFDDSDLFNMNLATYIANELLDDDEYMSYSNQLGDDFISNNWSRFIKAYCKTRGVVLSLNTKSKSNKENSSLICKTYSLGDNVNVDTFLSMHPYQRRMKSDILKSYFNSQIQRFLVHMPTGAGKTKTMMEALIHILDNVKDGGNVIWLAHSHAPQM